MGAYRANCIDQKGANQTSATQLNEDFPLIRVPIMFVAGAPPSRFSCCGSRWLTSGRDPASAPSEIRPLSPDNRSSG
jgi:hypothetical protein